MSHKIKCIQDIISYNIISYRSVPPKSVHKPSEQACGIVPPLQTEIHALYAN